MSNPTIFTPVAIDATNNLIAFYKDKIKELEDFKSDLEARKVEVGQTDFKKYQIKSKAKADRHMYWRKNQDVTFDERTNDCFSLLRDRQRPEYIGVASVEIREFANVLDSYINGEEDMVSDF